MGWPSPGDVDPPESDETGDAREHPSGSGPHACREPAITDGSGARLAGVLGDTIRNGQPCSRFVLAEMNTHHFVFRGAGHCEDAARSALLHAWTRHRTELLASYPERAGSLPEARDMERHFKIVYLKFQLNAGYRDDERLV